MPDEIVLLTEDAEAPHLGGILTRRNPDLVVTHARGRKELEEACLAADGRRRRLIAFCASVIVPPEILDAVMQPAYNFHPGPPTYPGSYVANFAIYDEAEMFGATVHEMAARVDSGPIVAVEWFRVPDGLRFTELEVKAYQALARLFTDLAGRLANDETALPRMDVNWSGKATTKKDYERLRAIDATVNEAEARRRSRAFG